MVIDSDLTAAKGVEWVVSGHQLGPKGPQTSDLCFPGKGQIDL